MLDIAFIRDHVDEIKNNCKRRNASVDIDALLQYDVARRDLQQKTDDLRSVRNRKSKGKPSDEEIAHMKKLGDEIKDVESELKGVAEKYQDLLLQVPNITHPDVPTGGEDDFNVLEVVGKPPKLKEHKDHEEILSDADLLDFEAGAKVAGSKFYYTKGDLVRLNMALMQYGIDVVTKHGFELIETPDLAKESIMIGAGFNPRGEEDQIYTIENTDLNLVGTAEITTLGYHADETLDLSKGPIKYAALSHCFRKEAGAYGRTSKGLYRVHQFSKLELFVFCTPEQSEALHEELKAIEKEICDGLELHYQLIDIATADLGAPAYRKYDIEAWMTMKGENGGFGEITSTSNCLDYQARRLNIKYKDADGNKGFAHTLNGTAIVLSRFPIAIVEQHQQPDGTVRIPKVLQQYIGKESIG